LLGNFTERRSAATKSLEEETEARTCKRAERIGAERMKTKDFKNTN
jgi:hypothetical protein